jgi:hypothetical protein
MDNKTKARQAVNGEVQAGRLPRIRTQKCACGSMAMFYHHHKGYDKKHWLDVIPVCGECHSAEHMPHNSSLKLSDDEVRQVRKLKKSGMHLGDIARHFGVGKSTITGATTGKSYRWVK